jgi:CRP-like cAMP-binding protein
VKLSVISAQGKEAVVAFLEAEDFCGEGCLAGQLVRMATAMAVTECTIVRVAKPSMIKPLHERVEFSELFMAKESAPGSELNKAMQKLPTSSQHRPDPIDPSQCRELKDSL